MRLERRLSQALQHNGRAMAAVEAYTATLVQLQGAVHVDAHAQGMTVLRQLDRTLTRLAVMGELTPSVMDGLMDLSEVALSGIDGLSTGVTARLTELAAAYPVASGPGRWDQALAFLADDTL